jgi:hypothetical protein
MLAAVLLALPISTGSAQTPASPPEKLDEVVITSQQLLALRKAVVAAEDRAYEVYNEVNTDDQYDIECRQSTRTGAIISERVCRPKLVETATSEEAVAFLDAVRANIQGSEDFPGQVLQRPRAPIANLVIINKKADYTENVLKMVRESPELRRRLKDWELAYKRYEDARKAHFRKDGQPEK